MEGRGCCVFPRLNFFYLFLQTESCNSFSQPESHDIFGGLRGNGQKQVNNVERSLLIGCFNVCYSFHLPFRLLFRCVLKNLTCFL